MTAPVASNVNPDAILPCFTNQQEHQKKDDASFLQPLRSPRSYQARSPSHSPPTRNDRSRSPRRSGSSPKLRSSPYPAAAPYLPFPNLDGGGSNNFSSSSDFSIRNGDRDRGYNYGPMRRSHSRGRIRKRRSRSRSRSRSPVLRRAKVFIGNFARDIEEYDLDHAFGYFGSLSDVFLPRDPPPIGLPRGEHRGFGFVTFKNKADAVDAIRGMDAREWKGRVIRVEMAKPRRSERGREREREPRFRRVEFCRDFARGRCTRENCRFSHQQTPMPQSQHHQQHQQHQQPQQEAPIVRNNSNPAV